MSHYTAPEVKNVPHSPCIPPPRCPPPEMHMELAASLGIVWDGWGRFGLSDSFLLSLSPCFLWFCFDFYPGVGWFWGSGFLGLPCAGQGLLCACEAFFFCCVGFWMLCFCPPFHLFSQFLRLVGAELHLLAFG